MIMNSHPDVDYDVYKNEKKIDRLKRLFPRPEVLTKEDKEKKTNDGNKV